MTYDQAETLYKNINNSNYSDALNKTKLSFINGDYGKDYMHPFYWSPYIYYYRK